MVGIHRLRGSQVRFSLAALFEYTTLCCLLAAFASVIGAAPLACLMLFALALAAGQGGLALALLIVASLAAALPIGSAANGPLAPQVATLFAAGVIGAWYRWRANRFSGQSPD